EEVLNEPGAEGMTLVVFAALWAWDEAPARLQIMTDLVRAGADVHHVVPDLASALGLALMAPGPGLLRAMLDGGVSPDVKIGGDLPALARVSAEPTEASMKLLLEYGADVNARDSLGTPVITHALHRMQLDQVEILLDHGADPRAVNRLGQSFPNVL